MLRTRSRRNHFWLTSFLLVGLLVPPALLSAEPSPDGATVVRDTSDPAGQDGRAVSHHKENKGESGEASGKEKDQPKEQPFDKVVKDAKEVKGLFTVYVKEDEAKYLLEIAPDQFDVTFLLNPTLVSGVGQGFLYPADVLPEYPVYFHQVGKTVQLIHKNALFRAAETSSMKKPASVAAPEAIVGMGKIESQPHPTRKSVLVDLGTFFLNDLEGMSFALKAVLDAPYQMDREGSSIASLKGFPQNLDFETVLHFKTGELKNPAFYVADPRSLLVRFHYSISRLPADGYRPRLADDRVGHFLAMMDDYTDDRPDQPTVRYITRWRLEKKDPGASLSEPKQPIVFYLENSIPKEYREAVRQGVLGWNPAFEAIGFKNALVVKPQPDDPDWDPADVRYSTLRWIVAPNAGFAQGPSRTNPYTGEIFDADIRFSADMIRFVRREFEEEVSSFPLPLPPAGLPTGAAALLRSLGSWASLLGPVGVDALLSNADERGAVSGAPALGAGTRPGMPKASLGYCDYAQGAVQQAALGLALMSSRGLWDPAQAEKYVSDFIVHVTLHEVGHTLGLRHNFKGSSIHPLDRLQDAAMTSRAGLTGSVMDYIPVNLAPQGKPQGEYWQTAVGPYDRWAIEYAYKPMTAESPEAEKPDLEKIASRAAERELAYGTDEDTFAGSARGIDPTSNMWDIGDDTFAFYRNRAAIARELFAQMENRFSEPGTRYQKLRNVFAMGIREIAPAAMNVPKYIGGIRHYRDHIGDPHGRLPYVPVPAAEQREALVFLNREIFGPEAFRFSPQLLNKLALERFPDIEGNIWRNPRNDLPIHALVLAIQSIPMDRLYHPIALGRIHDLEERYDSREKAFTMAEMFSSVRGAVWQELQTRSSVGSFRRNLQRKHLQTLVNLAVDLGPTYPEDARTLARADLLAIRRGIDASLGSPARLDAVTRAHLDETRARINAALEAGLERQLPQPAPPGGQS